MFTKTPRLAVLFYNHSLHASSFGNAHQGANSFVRPTMPPLPLNPYTKPAMKPTDLLAHLQARGLTVNDQPAALRRHSLFSNQSCNPLTNVILNSSNFIQRPTLRIGKQPVGSTQTRHVGAVVSAAHRHQQVSVFG
jgi:hypothetical protein